jgi:HAD superfamily hydrolase (TIGR01549 family)
MFDNIQYLLWDVDGTLYRSNPALFQDIRQEILIRITEGLHVPMSNAEMLFQERYNRLGGSTAAVVDLGLDRRLILKAVDAVDKSKYIRADKQLKHMIEVSLSGYTQLIITNTSRQGTFRTLELLELDPNLFKTIITADDVTHSKPDPEPFLKALELTEASPPCHLSIGDREAVDIAPAKKLGMKTLIVWGQSQLADYSASTIQEIAAVLPRR